MFPCKNSNHLYCDLFIFLSVCTLAGCVYEWTSQSEFHKRTLYSLTEVKPGVFEHFGFFLFLHMPAAWLQLYPSSFVSGEFFKMAQKKASLLRNRLLWWLQKKKFHKIKFGLETTDQTRTHTRTSTVCKLTHSQFAVHWGILSPSFSHTHTCTHTDLHSLIWVDSGNHSSELAGGPGSGGGVEGGERGGDQSEDERSRLAEKKQQKREERRKESLEREEKRKENFLCSWAMRIQEGERIWNPSI